MAAATYSSTQTFLHWTVFALVWACFRKVEKRFATSGRHSFELSQAQIVE